MRLRSVSFAPFGGRFSDHLIPPRTDAGSREVACRAVRTDLGAPTRTTRGPRSRCTTCWPGTAGRTRSRPRPGPAANRHGVAPVTSPGRPTMGARTAPRRAGTAGRGPRTSRPPSVRGQAPDPGRRPRTARGPELQPPRPMSERPAQPPTRRGGRRLPRQWSPARGRRSHRPQPSARPVSGRPAEPPTRPAARRPPRRLPPPPRGRGCRTNRPPLPTRPMSERPAIRRAAPGPPRRSPAPPLGRGPRSNPRHPLEPGSRRRSRPSAGPVPVLTRGRPDSNEAPHRPSP